jgi:NAD(P)-dependent dehydrogenase (short-subunit alcohol dehydrogenase family)
MASDEATELLRAGVLDGVCVLVASADREGGAGADAGEDAASESAARAAAASCAALGARVASCGLLDAGEGGGSREEDEIDEDVTRTLDALGEIDMLIVDAGGLCAAARAAGGGGERSGLMVGVETSWKVTRAVANAAFLARGRPGRVVYLCPAPAGGSAYAKAAVAGLENLARTLSIEWARHGVTTVAIAPSASTTAGEQGALCAYLASPAGAYFSGALLDLRGGGES